MEEFLLVIGSDISRKYQHSRDMTWSLPSLGGYHRKLWQSQQSHVNIIETHHDSYNEKIAHGGCSLWVTP